MPLFPLDLRWGQEGENFTLRAKIRLGCDVQASLLLGRWEHWILFPLISNEVFLTQQPKTRSILGFGALRNGLFSEVSQGGQPWDVLDKSPPILTASSLLPRMLSPPLRSQADHQTNQKKWATPQHLAQANPRCILLNYYLPWAWIRTISQLWCCSCRGCTQLPQQGLWGRWAVPGSDEDHWPLSWPIHKWPTYEMVNRLQSRTVLLCSWQMEGSFATLSPSGQPPSHPRGKVLHLSMPGFPFQGRLWGCSGWALHSILQGTEACSSCTIPTGTRDSTSAPEAGASWDISLRGLSELSHEYSEPTQQQDLF